jgi:hypothetical protein
MIAQCPHVPPCPPAGASDREAASVIATFPEQGWSLLCNGVIVFDDTGLLLPDGGPIGPHDGFVTACVTAEPHAK